MLAVAQKMHIQCYQANADLSVAASKTKLKKQLLDAESAEYDAVDHPFTKNKYSSVCTQCKYVLHSSITGMDWRIITKAIN